MVDDINVADGGASEEKSETDMPVGLGSGTEDGDGADGGTFEEQTGGGEGSAEGGECLGSEEGHGGAVGVKKSERSGG